MWLFLVGLQWTQNQILTVNVARKSGEKKGGQALNIEINGKEIEKTELGGTEEQKGMKGKSQQEVCSVLNKNFNCFSYHQKFVDKLTFGLVCMEEWWSFFEVHPSRGMTFSARWKVLTWCRVTLRLGHPTFHQLWSWHDLQEQFQKSWKRRDRKDCPIDGFISDPSSG